MDEHLERHLRRKAVRLRLRGLPPRAILRQIPRSRTWLHKWYERFRRDGWPGLRSQPRRPQHFPQAYSHPVRAAVLRARRILEQRRVGLIGPSAIRAELQSWAWHGPLPSSGTIKRILRQAGITAAPPPERPPYFPQPTATHRYRLQAIDWTARYLPGGPKVFAFHTLDVQTHALAQTIGRDKSLVTVRQHLLATWQYVGCPDGLQMDNDAAFCGGYQVRRVFGQIVRLCLYVGIEPIFIPVGEPQRNGLVERLNGLWSQSFWQRRHFRSLAEVEQASPEFVAWYTHEYHPPALAGQTPAQAARQMPARCLSAPQIRALPAQLPISAGRVHFIRRVSTAGEITLLNETWAVGKRWAGQYVWATIVTHRQQLRVYHRANAHAPVRLIKQWTYRISEPIAPLDAQYRRPYRRRKMFTML